MNTATFAACTLSFSSATKLKSESLSQGFFDFLDPIGDLVGDVGEVLEDAVNEIGDAFEDVGDWFSNDFVNFWEKDFVNFWEDDFVNALGVHN